MKSRAQLDHHQTAIKVEQAISDDMTASRRQYQQHSQE
jgi:hypothetical protein